MRYLIPLLVIGVVSGCGEKVEKAAQAVGALTELAKNAEKMQEAGKLYEKASKEAEAEARANVADGVPKELADQQVALAKHLAGMKAMEDAAGPIVNWRQLQDFLPDKIGNYVAKEELEGKTESVSGFRATTVERAYGSGDHRMRIKITDASYSSMMLLPFTMGMHIEEDSTSGYRKTKKLMGHQAMVSWKKDSAESKVTGLVDGRFVVNVRIWKTDSPDEAETLYKKLDISRLAKVRGKKEN